MYWCRGYDLTIASRWPVPGAMTIAPATSECRDQVDLRIVERPADSGVCHPRGALPGIFTFGLRGFGYFACDAGRHLEVMPAKDVSVSDLLGALIATAIPAALWMRGDLVLHAAGVQLPGADRAIAIAGPSMSGKSMLLEQLVRMGGRVVGDDTLCIRGSGSQAEISGLPGSYFLREGTTNLVRPRRMVMLSDARQLPRARLGTLLVLDPERSKEPPEFHRLRGPAAVEALLQNLHRYWIPRQLRIEATLFPKIAHSMKQLAVYSWRRQEGSPALCEREINFLNHCLDLQGSANGNDIRSFECLT